MSARKKLVIAVCLLTVIGQSLVYADDPPPTGTLPLVTPSEDTSGGSVPISQHVRSASENANLFVGGGIGAKAIQSDGAHCDTSCCPGTRFWVSADYLLWWVKNSPQRVPLVTSGDLADAVPGALGQPGTRVLVGGGNEGFGSFSGARFAAGMWLDSDNTIGLEAGAFFLERRNRIFSAASDATGAPLLAVPFFDAAAGLESSYISSAPGAAIGMEAVHNSTRLWGFEFHLTGAANPARAQARWLLGYRHLRLDETLNAFQVFQPMIGGFNVGATPAAPGDLISSFDRFGVRNQFNGGQVGVRADWESGIWSANVVGKLALGVMRESVTIDGGSLLINNQLQQTFVPGGIFALPSNMGRHSRDMFAVVPELNFNVGLQLTPAVRAQAGYSVLYISNVARPGNQIDRVVNSTAVPTDAQFGGGGVARPAFNFVGSDYWAQGLNFGIELRY